MPAYKDEKTGKWYCKLYYQDYTGQKRQKLKRGFSTLRDAKAWEADFLSRAAADPAMPFKDMVSLYLKDQKANVKQSTYAPKEYRFKKWILPYFENKPINEIKAVDIRRWETELKTTVSQKGKVLSPSYLLNIYADLSSVFNFAIRFYGLTNNPCKIAGNTMGKRIRSMNFWTKDQFDQFISTFDREDPFYAAFLLLYYTGIRIGELMALTVGDINMENHELTVSKTCYMMNGERIITPPKTEKSIRTILLPPFLVECLKRYISRIYAPQSDTRLFTMSGDRLRQYMNRHAEMAGLERIRIHDLRHSHASLLIEMGFSAILVSERLGHENVSTTLNIYSHLFPSKQSEMVDRLEALCRENDY